MSFDPNELDEYKQPEWATYIAGRRPAFKMHTDRGKALNAASYHSRPVQIFRWDPNFAPDKGKWIEVFNGRVESTYGRSSSHDICERCGKSTITETSFSRSTNYGGHESGVRRSNSGSMGWLATLENKKRLVEPFRRAWLCRSCKK